jgi:NADH:ubiquinone oxidoreductase subunit D
MEFYERCSGARMHAAFHRPAMMFNDFLSKDFFQDLLYFVRNCYSTIEEIHNILTYNKI